MSDGHYCLLRDLGLVKGGKGLKHHEVVVDFTLRGMKELSKRLLVEKVREAARAIRLRGVKTWLPRRRRAGS